MFNFSRGQRNGLVVLSILLVISLLIPFLDDYFSKDFTTSFEAFEKEIDNAKKCQKQVSKKTLEIELFDFNPNTTTEEDFQRLGLSEKQMKQIINYRNKNGRFYDKEDFNKIYAIDQKTYHRLEAYDSWKIAAAAA